MDETGSVVKRKESLVYLGSLIFVSGRTYSEVSRRIGLAFAVFKELDRVWKHASLCKTKKLDIYRAIVLANLLYGLQSAWLCEADLKRLDGFHCRSLLETLKSPPAFDSRVSNEQVLQKVGQRKARMLLLQ